MSNRTCFRYSQRNIRHFVRLIKYKVRTPQSSHENTAGEAYVRPPLRYEPLSRTAGQGSIAQCLIRVLFSLFHGLMQDEALRTRMSQAASVEAGKFNIGRIVWHRREIMEQHPG